MTINIEQEARRYARIVVTAMQSGYQGLYDARTETIYIADNLTPTQYRCVLAHEVSHAKHQDKGGHSDRYTEQRADVEAARMLISQADYVTAEILYGMRDSKRIKRNAMGNPGIQKLAARQRGRIG